MTGATLIFYCWLYKNTVLAGYTQNDKM